MYSEHELYENYSDVDDNDHSSITSSTNTIDTMTINQKKMMKSLNRQDPNYISFKTNINYGKPLRPIWRKIRVYSTKVNVGSQIRDAVSGRYTSYRVGSKDELLFFKSINVSGIRTPTSEPAVLFFESPEQYERHMSTKLSVEQKERWQEKYHRALAKK
jgi:hypothetical protein